MYQSKYAKTPAEGLERKNEAIGRFQDSKELSIRVSAAGRDATMIVSEYYTHIHSHKNDEEMEKFLQEKWLMWREFFFKQYDNNEVAKNLTSPF